VPHELLVCGAIRDSHLGVWEVPEPSKAVYGPILLDQDNLYHGVGLFYKNEAGDPQYRLRAIATGAERVAVECDLWPA
jgi:hypothetical protein